MSRVRRVARMPVERADDYYRSPCRMIAVPEVHARQWLPVERGRASGRRRKRPLVLLKVYPQTRMRLGYDRDVWSQNKWPLPLSKVLSEGMSLHHGQY